MMSVNIENKVKGTARQFFLRNRQVRSASRWGLDAHIGGIK